MATASGIEYYALDLNKFSQELYQWAEFEYPYGDTARKFVEDKLIPVARMQNLDTALTYYFGDPNYTTFTTVTGTVSGTELTTTVTGTLASGTLGPDTIILLRDTMLNYKAGYNLSDAYDIATGDFIPEVYTP